MTRDVPRQAGGDRDRGHRDADLAVVLRPLLPQVSTAYLMSKFVGLSVDVVC